MTETNSAYVPGVCNINHEEIAARRKAGIVGVVAFIIIAALLFFGFSRWYRVILFVPAFIAAIGFLQARNHFCVAFAAGSKQRANDADADVHEVVDAESRIKDKQKARLINLQAAGIALLITLICIVLPQI